MTKQFEVLLAVKALVTVALTGADVRGFDTDAEVPDRIGSGGCVLGFPGEPGQPEVDLSPPAYNYSHRIPLEVAAAGGASGTALDVMLAAIGTAVAADRTLGGLCSYLDVDAAELGDASGEMVTSINWAATAIVAEYQTNNPLG